MMRNAGQRIAKRRWATQEKFRNASARAQLAVVDNYYQQTLPQYGYTYTFTPREDDNKRMSMNRRRALLCLMKVNRNSSRTIWMRQKKNISSVLVLSPMPGGKTYTFFVALLCGRML